MTWGAWRVAKGRKVSISTWFSNIQASEGAQQLWATPLSQQMICPQRSGAPPLLPSKAVLSFREAELQGKKWHFSKLPSTYSMRRQPAAGECDAESQYWALKPSWKGTRSHEYSGVWPFLNPECQTRIPRVTNCPQLFKHQHGYKGTTQEQVSHWVPSEIPKSSASPYTQQCWTPWSSRTSPQTPAEFSPDQTPAPILHTSKCCSSKKRCDVLFSHHIINCSQILICWTLVLRLWCAWLIRADFTEFY